MDIRQLLDVTRNHADDIGAPPALDAFVRNRARDVTARARVIDLYNRICRSGEPPVQALRSLGLRLAHDVKPLRRGIMRAGLGG